MPCQNNDPACPGPYSATTCDLCEAVEGDKCSRAKPAVGCGGPFSKPCGICKNFSKNFGKPDYLKMAARRSATKSWARTKLNLGNVDLKTVYEKSCTYSPAQIDQKYQQVAARRAVDCPWIEIGRLFATVTTGNDAGWGDLIKVLHGRGERNFSVFTGRHGTTQGTLTEGEESELFCDKVPDANHLLQDIIMRAQVEGKYIEDVRPRIRLYNVGTTAGTTMSKTQMLASERLIKGDIVIFAWCWSILSPFKVAMTSQAAQYDVFEMNQPYNRPINEIVNEKYGWVAVAEGMRARGVVVRSAWKDNDPWRKKVASDRAKIDALVKQHGAQSEQVSSHVHHV